MLGEQLTQIHSIEHGRIANLLELEQKQVVFIHQVYNELAELLPRVHQLPLFYLGSGGDTLSTVGTQADIFMITHAPFLAKDATQNFGSVQELVNFASAQAIINPGNYSHFLPSDAVRPGLQIFEQLTRLGVMPTEVLQNQAGTYYQLKLPQQDLHFLDYYVRNAAIFNEITQGNYVQDYGLLCKGFRKGLKLMAEILNQEDHNLRPAYFITDDIRFQSYHYGQFVDPITTLTFAEEANILFPGYNCREILSNNLKWGYKANSMDKDYKTRAIIGVRNDLV